MSLLYHEHKNTLTDTRISYNNNVIAKVPHATFLGLDTENTLSWNLHTDNVIKKLTSVCYMLRSVKPYMTLSSLMTCYSLFQFVIILQYYLLGTFHKYPKTLYITRAVRLITGHLNWTSCRNLFKQLKILPLKPQYIF
jgi:hypothetical protein